jgi:DNA (cytosine-5)-methyltransferase 1
MAELDLTANALADAKSNIRKLQEKVTDAILKMAAEVEKLATVVAPSQARAFLKAHCNLPTSELSTLAKFASTLKGSESVLKDARASFPVIKALVSVDEETRREVIERMELGAQLDARDIGAIRRKLAETA